MLVKVSLERCKPPGKRTPLEFPQEENFNPLSAPSNFSGNSRAQDGMGRRFKAVFGWSKSMFAMEDEPQFALSARSSRTPYLKKRLLLIRSQRK